MRPVPRPRAPSNGASLPGTTSIRLLTEGLWFESYLRSHLNQALARPPLLNFTKLHRIACGPSVGSASRFTLRPVSPILSTAGVRPSITVVASEVHRPHHVLFDEPPPRRCHIAPTTRSASPRGLIDTCSFTSSQLLSASHQRSNPALAASPKSSAPFNSHRCLAVRAASFKSLYLQRPHNGHQTTLIERALQIQPKDL
jgi:hypothetical protein